VESIKKVVRSAASGVFPGNNLTCAEFECIAGSAKDLELRKPSSFSLYDELLLRLGSLLL
jgi:hypothetical protein